ncbi:hypothetical protein EHQ58_10035 [Leptospira ognonensis]|uniref:Uncharacterized protein n=1 Tax=Leptospira ognonensis TaxID=2484945 RepID=A0A4R9K1G8_9LEPT|nr:hypothetical protein [Leptospira ognonensis]TGL58650.1 hypothetical protein EHQ58_10035 [Leptospira ognonensis]
MTKKSIASKHSARQNPAYESARAVYKEYLSFDLTYEEYANQDTLFNNQNFILLDNGLSLPETRFISPLIAAHSGRLVDLDRDPRFIIVADSFKEDLRLTQLLGKERALNITIITVDEFRSMLLAGIRPIHFEDDGVTNKHSGMKLIAKHGFKWPTLNLNVKSKYYNNSGLPQLNPESLLKSRYGYSADMKSNKYVRQEKLSQAVCDIDLGLRDVAYHLQFLVLYGNNNHKMQNSIKKWIEDLEWLKMNYFDREIAIEFGFLDPNKEDEFLDLLGRFVREKSFPELSRGLIFLLSR